MRAVMLALFGVAAVGMTYVMADVGPATAVLSPADIESAKATNRAAAGAPAAMPSGSYTMSSESAELMPVSQDDQAAGATATLPEEQPRRRSAGSQRTQARNADASARAQKRDWTNSFFDR